MKKTDENQNQINPSKIIASIIVKLKGVKANFIKEKYIPYGSEDSDEIFLSLNDIYTFSDNEKININE